MHPSFELLLVDKVLWINSHTCFYLQNNLKSDKDGNCCIPECILAAGGPGRGLLAFDKDGCAHAWEEKCVRMITVGQWRQIIQLNATVGLIPRARRFSKEKKQNKKTLVLNRAAILSTRERLIFSGKVVFLRQLFQDFWGVESAGGVSDGQLAQQLAEESRDLDSFLRHFARVLVLSL